MAKRSLETLTDVLVLIVSPILVMILVGSLAFFLIQCFYDGQFFGRLNFATGLFVMSAVLVARIAIEEGREYASAFALPLGVVTILSMLQYTDLGPFLAIPLVLFIWWSTDKLTWDCTVLDEDKDASGEGLLQTIGLDEGGEGVDEDATTDREKTESKSLWQKWLDRRRRHHTPGVWVIYFGLAAIPLFGIGQSVLPDGSRGAGFLLLCTYVATALSLLMITSFLQMRPLFDPTSSAVHRKNGCDLAGDRRDDHHRADGVVSAAATSRIPAIRWSTRCRNRCSGRRHLKIARRPSGDKAAKGCVTRRKTDEARVMRRPSSDSEQGQQASRDAERGGRQDGDGEFGQRRRATWRRWANRAIRLKAGASAVSRSRAIVTEIGRLIPAIQRIRSQRRDESAFGIRNPPTSAVVTKVMELATQNRRTRVAVDRTNHRWNRHLFRTL